MLQQACWHEKAPSFHNDRAETISSINSKKDYSTAVESALKIFSSCSTRTGIVSDTVLPLASFHVQIMDHFPVARSDSRRTSESDVSQTLGLHEQTRINVINITIFLPIGLTFWKNIIITNHTRFRTCLCRSMFRTPRKPLPDKYQSLVHGRWTK